MSAVRNLTDGSLKRASPRESFGPYFPLSLDMFLECGRAQQSCFYPGQVTSFSLVEPLTLIVIHCWMATFAARLLNDIIIEVYLEVAEDVTCLEGKL